MKIRNFNARTLPKRAAHLLVSLLLAGILFVAGFFLVPEINVPESSLKFVVERAAPAELRTEWGVARLQLVRTGWFDKEVRLSVDGLCLRLRSRSSEKEAEHGEALRTCWGQVKWGVGISFARLRPYITSYLPLLARDGSLSIDLDDLQNGETPQPANEDSSVKSTNWLGWLRTSLLPKWRYDGSLLELRALDLKTGGRMIRSALLLETAATFHQSTMSGRADAQSKRRLQSGSGVKMLRLTIFELQSGGKTGRLSGQLHLLMPNTDGGAWRILADLDASLRPKRGIRVAGEAEIHDWQNVDFALRARLERLAPLRNLSMNGTYRRDNVTGLLSAQLGRIESTVKSIDFVECDYSVFLNASELSLQCGPQAVRMVLLERGPIRDPAFFRLAPRFLLRLSHVSWEDGLAVDWKFALQLQHQGFLRLALDTSGNLARRPTIQGPRLLFNVRGDGMAEVTRFDRLVRFLRQTPYAVPAPLNQLTGPVVLHVDGTVSERGGILRSEFNSRLRSEHQKIFISADAEANFSPFDEGRRPDVQAEVILQDVRLTLPRLPLKVPPQLVRDRRFQKGLALDGSRSGARKHVRQSRRESTPANEQPSSQRTFPIDLRLRIATAAEGRLQISSNFTRAPVPVTLLYTLQTAQRSSPVRPVAERESRVVASPLVSYGVIRLGRTPLELLRREAYIDNFTLRLQKDGERTIDGKLSVVYPDYTIYIYLNGTIEQPSVRMESDPPLAERQMISVLLFGKPLEQLAGDQEDSVAQLDAALADAALSFSSLYLLANTPIESVGYDPERRMVTAKVPLGEGTSLELGRSGSGATEVGLRRRISRNWTLNTSVEDSADHEGRVMAAFIEWIKRF